MTMRILATCTLAALAVLTAAPALADCAADATVSDVRQAYARGQQKEKAGDARGALGAYVAAQEYTCDPNPVAAEAARRAAAIAKPLGDAARAKGDHAAAFDFYERGGHFAAADRELMARIEAAPDDAALYGEALRHTQYRALPAFQKNEEARIQATGPYALDATLVRALAAIPIKAADRALAAEAAAFDESWYAQYMALIGSRPENPTDFVALQQFGSRMQQFQAAHPKDPLREPLEALRQLRNWESQVVDGKLAETLARRRAERADARAAVLVQKYAGAPQLLELAIDYLGQTSADSAAREPRVQKVRRQAEALGDAALAAKRYQLAIDYFGVARASGKEESSRTALQAMAQQQMQPSIAAMQRDAEALRAQFADPQKIAEMQRQAQEVQRSLQSGQQARKSQSGSSADALAAELGM
jgi:hypothetical protein